MVAPSGQRHVSSVIAHVHTTARKSLTLAAESVMKPCMEIAAQEIHGGTIDCDLSVKTAIVRYHGGQPVNCTTQVFEIMLNVRYNNKLQPFFPPSENIS